MATRRKPNAGVMRRWVAALRGGEYKQTRLCLHDSVGFCCLGVLCDLYVKSKANVVGAKWLLSPTTGNYTLLGSCGTLPKEVYRWAGLSDCNVVLKGTDFESRLTATLANDGSPLRGLKGRSFKVIANMIEKRYLCE